MKPVDLDDDGDLTLNAWKEFSGTRNTRLHDKVKMRISLKQWRVLHAVIDCNGFSAAAEKLHISQSAISYTIAKMQEQLGIPLLRVEGRKAQVTREGRALLEKSRNVIRSAIELEALAEKMRQGWKQELRLMVHHECPQHFVMAAIEEISRSTPGIRVMLQEGGDDELEQALCNDAVDLAICAQAPLGLIAEKLVSVDYVAVVDAEHPLTRMSGLLNWTHLANHVRIMLDTPRATLRTPGAEAVRRGQSPLRVRNLDMMLSALREKAGYAWLPLQRARPLLEAGALKQLEISPAYCCTRDFHLVRACTDQRDAGSDCLAGALHAHAKACAGHL
ncbi:LysR family transcriptional regulator [Noviherbaspirillum pedocola]|uniref:LysR family transcriptional regulator n=1 Tax=Noviherbaspirillum pedocola TaxID=2801341 RepID=A0A934WA56_9BURK|nr:LysR family transcriptional regulator [Noviherbaspirillum pedocola]MBK4738144.1 LysR family transcriptional regulator [Noviherbaspirillum pedocola]